MSSRKKVRKAKPASTVAVAKALKEFHDSAATGKPAAEKFLDKVGFLGLEHPEAVKALSDDACRAIASLLQPDDSEDRTGLAEAVLERMMLADPTESTGGASAHNRTCWIWLGYAGGLAVKHLHPDDPSVKERLTQTTRMPLASFEWASNSLRQAVLRHPSCPESILYLAANTWTADQALIAIQHPSASDEARVAAVLRGLPVPALT